MQQVLRAAERHLPFSRSVWTNSSSAWMWWTPQSVSSLMHSSRQPLHAKPSWHLPTHLILIQIHFQVKPLSTKASCSSAHCTLLDRKIHLTGQGHVIHQPAQRQGSLLGYGGMAKGRWVFFLLCSLCVAFLLSVWPHAWGQGDQWAVTHCKVGETVSSQVCTEILEARRWKWVEQACIGSCIP